MSYSDEFLENITIDVCKKTFMLYMDDGQKRKVKCDTTQQFMDVLQLINNSADPMQHAGQPPCSLPVSCETKPTLKHRVSHNSSVQLSLVQDGIYALGKAHMRSTPSLRSFSNVAFEMHKVTIDWTNPR